MIWDKKYKPFEPEIICPECEQRIDRKEWDDFGMHYECTEYYKMKRFLEYGIRGENERIKDVTKTVINEI